MDGCSPQQSTAANSEAGGESDFQLPHYNVQMFNFQQKVTNIHRNKKVWPVRREKNKSTNCP